METRRQSKRKDAASGGSNLADNRKASKRSRQSIISDDPEASAPAVPPKRGSGSSSHEAANRSRSKQEQQQAPNPLPSTSSLGRTNRAKPSPSDAIPVASARGTRSNLGASRHLSGGKEKSAALPEKERKDKVLLAFNASPLLAAFLTDLYHTPPTLNFKFFILRLS